MLTSIQGLVYNVSLRFLWEREDAEDATQEILIKVITNLGKYSGKSKLSTWVYRVAVNYLLNVRKTKIEKAVSFDAFARDLGELQAPAEYDLPDRMLMERELKTACTMAMLQCLNRDLRIAFILGSVLKLKSKIAAEVVGISPENFRKRVEKSRKLLRSFLGANCGVYNPANPCRCKKRINTALKCGLIHKRKAHFSGQVEELNEEMEEFHSMEGIYHNHGNIKSDTDIVRQINALLSRKEISNID